MEQSRIEYIRDVVQNIRLNASLNRRFLSLANESSLSVMPDDDEELLDGHITAGCYCWWILGEEYFRLVRILLLFSCYIFLHIPLLIKYKYSMFQP